MSDCALAITNAVLHVYLGTNEAPKHYWCICHVLKAFRGKAKTYLGIRWAEAFTEFRSIMYSPTNPTGDFYRFMHCWNDISPGFAGYVNRQWTPRLPQWDLFFQTVS
jgi:hypothetical protein